jgi:hypothetical protein
MHRERLSVLQRLCIQQYAADALQRRMWCSTQMDMKGNKQAQCNIKVALFNAKVCRVKTWFSKQPTDLHGIRCALFFSILSI